MPSKNPRLSVVLPPSVAATLAAISAETGDSASSLVRGLLEQTEPALQRMLELVRAAKAAKGQIGDGMRGSMDRVIDDLHDALAVADARTGRVLADLVTQAEGVKGRRRPAARTGAARPGGRVAAHPLPPAKVQAYADTNGLPPAASTPGPVTRGSGTPREGGDKPEGGGVRAAKGAVKGVRRGRV